METPLTEQAIDEGTTLRCDATAVRWLTRELR
jgi:hypothetical protein